MAFLWALLVFILMLLPTVGCILIGFALHASARHVELWILLANTVYLIAVLILLPFLHSHDSPPPHKPDDRVEHGGKSDK